jgi:DNA-binding transcriptional LysR family regulator
MDLFRLRYFVVVAQTGSIRRAADILGISPSAVSRAIKQLEEEWRVTLFSQSGRGIAITDFGRALQHRATRLLGEVEAFASAISVGNSDEELLRVGTFEIFSTYFLGWAIREFFPQRRVLLRELLPGEIERALINMEIDVGLTTLPVPQEGIDFLKISTDTMGIVGRHDSPLHGPIADLPFCVPIAPVPGAALGVQGLDGWPIDAPPRKIRFQVQMLGTALELCSHGRAVMYCPGFLVGLYNAGIRPDRQLQRRVGPEGLPRGNVDLFLVKRSSTQEGRDIRILARAVRRCVRELSWESNARPATDGSC